MSARQLKGSGKKDTLAISQDPHGSFTDPAVLPGQTSNRTVNSSCWWLQPTSTSVLHLRAQDILFSLLHYNSTDIHLQCIKSNSTESLRLQTGAHPNTMRALQAFCPGHTAIPLDRPRDLQRFPPGFSPSSEWSTTCTPTQFQAL